MSLPTSKTSPRRSRTGHPSLSASAAQQQWEAHLRSWSDFIKLRRIVGVPRPAALSASPDRSISVQEFLAVIRPGAVRPKTKAPKKRRPSKADPASPPQRPAGEGGRGAGPSGRSNTAKADFHRYLVSIGFMTQLPDHASDFEDPDDQPVELQGEPLSDTIIRERG